MTKEFHPEFYRALTRGSGYVMLRHAMSCPVISCRVAFHACLVAPSLVMSCHITRRYVVSSRVSHVWPCHVMSCHQLTCPVLSGYVMSCHVLTRRSCHVSRQVPSCRFLGVIFHVALLVASSCLMGHVMSVHLASCCTPIAPNSCPVMSCHLFVCHVMSRHVTCNELPGEVRSSYNVVSIVVSLALRHVGSCGLFS